MWIYRRMGFISWEEKKTDNEFFKQFGNKTNFKKYYTQLFKKKKKKHIKLMKKLWGKRGREDLDAGTLVNLLLSEQCCYLINQLMVEVGNIQVCQTPCCLGNVTWWQVLFQQHHHLPMKQDTVKFCCYQTPISQIFSAAPGKNPQQLTSASKLSFQTESVNI